jgi:hypothetical protein
MRHLLSLAALSLGLAACNNGDVMSCSNSDDGVVTACYEFSNFEGGLFGLGLQASMTTLCTVIGSKPTSGACPTDNLVGGCAGDEQESYDYVEWSYADDEVDSLSDISCGSDEVLVGPDGEPVSPTVHDTCSIDSPTSVTPTFQNNHTGEVTLYWINQQCAEVAYTSIPAGGSVQQQTFSDHVWIAREGNSDPLGAIVWEYTVTAQDDGATLSIP